MTQTRELATFIVGGLGATVIHFVCAYVLFEQYNLHYLYSNFLAFMLANCFSFMWHYHLTFASNAAINQAYLRFFCVSLCSLAYTQAFLTVGMESLQIAYLPLLVTAIVTSAALTFLLNRHWSFA